MHISVCAYIQYSSMASRDPQVMYAPLQFENFTSVLKCMPATYAWALSLVHIHIIMYCEGYYNNHSCVRKWTL